MLFFIIISFWFKRSEKGSLKITITSNNTDAGSVIIDWSAYSYADKVFKVYRSIGNESFEMIPIDYTQVKNVNCLHVYPESGAKNQLKSWMDQYGKGIINVYPVYINDFNNNPSKYLEGDNEMDFDVALAGPDLDSIAGVFFRTGLRVEKQRLARNSDICNAHREITFL